jgi:hypothetical protein
MWNVLIAGIPTHILQLSAHLICPSAQNDLGFAHSAPSQNILPKTRQCKCNFSNLNTATYIWLYRIYTVNAFFVSCYLNFPIFWILLQNLFLTHLLFTLLISSAWKLIPWLHFKHLEFRTCYMWYRQRNQFAMLEIYSILQDLTNHIMTFGYKHQFILKNNCFLNSLMGSLQFSLVPMQTCHWSFNTFFLFFATPVYLQSVPVNSANCVKTYTMTRRKVLSSTPT